MSTTTTVTREKIEKLVRRINEIENARPHQSADEIVEKLSALMVENTEGWVNGKHISDRTAVDELDRALYELIDDYHRDIDHLIIDPPFVSFDWCMKSVKRNLEGKGCSIIEVDGAGLQLRFWMYFDPEPFKKIGII
jgi:hypothetical protein